MKYLIISLLLASCAHKQVTPIPFEWKCRTVVIYNNGRLPTCSFRILDIFVADAPDQSYAFEKIHDYACQVHGDLFIVQESGVGLHRFRMKGFIAKCVVPFAMQSDYVNRGQERSWVH